MVEGGDGRMWGGGGRFLHPRSTLLSLEMVLVSTAVRLEGDMWGLIPSGML